jgi:hypothetical protein
MRTTAFIMITLGIVLCGNAGANPIVGEWFYIDFDPPNFAHRVDPVPYTSFSGYVMLDLNQSAEDGFASVSFRLDYGAGMTTTPAFTNLLPGDLSIGLVEEGITVASTECITTFPAAIGRIDMFYLGVPGDVVILDHPEYPRWLVNCADPGEVFYYCVYSNGGVGKDPDMGPMGDCGGNPVEAASWTGIKSLYR